jgi:DNA-binding beta-propeller fold protein YncE
MSHRKKSFRSLFPIALLSVSLAGAAEIRQIALEANDLVADPVSGKIYASVPGTATANANNVVLIEPLTGEVEATVFVGSEPGPLAISDDGTTLYVSLDGAAAVRRVDVTTMTAGIQFPLGNDPFFGPYVAEDIEVMPGSPGSIAVSRKNLGISPRHAGVAIYDDGVQRPNETARHTGSNRIEFSSDAGVLYGYNNETTEFGFRRMIVDAAGVTEDNVTGNLITGFGVEIEYEDGRIYATTGVVLEPETPMLLGTYPEAGFSRGVAVDSDAGVVYILESQGTIRKYDLNLFTLIDTIPIPEVSGGANSLVLWGAGALAFLTSENQVFFVEDPPRSFRDVPPDYWAFSFIETLNVSGITGGCGDNNYCPEDQVTRAQMAVFLERGMRGSDFVPPPATGNTFLDVAATDFAASYIEQLFLDAITGGCGNGNYCPNDAVTRSQMAVFLLRAKYGSQYVPPPPTGERFADVDLSYWSVSWIEQLAAEGITGGCGNSNFCPEEPVTRAQMAVFLVRTFGLGQPQVGQ